VFLRRN